MNDTTIHSPVNIADRKKLAIHAGDTVRVWQKIVDRTLEKGKIKEKSRVQAFEGLVLARKHGKEAGATFTVRRVASGVGVERIFPLYSPLIEKIETIRRAKVRRAKLYNIRDKAAKEISREMRKIIKVTREETDKAIKDKEGKENALAEEKKTQEKAAREAKEAKAAEATKEETSKA